MDQIVADVSYLLVTNLMLMLMILRNLGEKQYIHKYLSLILFLSHAVVFTISVTGQPNAAGALCYPLQVNNVSIQNCCLLSLR